MPEHLGLGLNRARRPGRPTQKTELTFSLCVTGACESRTQHLLPDHPLSLTEADILSPEILEEESRSIMCSMKFTRCLFYPSHSLCRLRDILF